MKAVVVQNGGVTIADVIRVYNTDFVIKLLVNTKEKRVSTKIAYKSFDGKIDCFALGMSDQTCDSERTLVEIRPETEDEIDLLKNCNAFVQYMKYGAIVFIVREMEIEEMEYMPVEFETGGK